MFPLLIHHRFLRLSLRLGKEWQWRCAQSLTDKFWLYQLVSAELFSPWKSEIVQKKSSKFHAMLRSSLVLREHWTIKIWISVESSRWENEQVNYKISRLLSRKTPSNFLSHVAWPIEMLILVFYKFEAGSLLFVKVVKSSVFLWKSSAADRIPNQDLTSRWDWRKEASERSLFILSLQNRVNEGLRIVELEVIDG